MRWSGWVRTVKLVSRGGAVHRRRAGRKDDVNDEDAARSVCNFVWRSGAHVRVSLADKLQGGGGFRVQGSGFRVQGSGFRVVVSGAQDVLALSVHAWVCHAQERGGGGTQRLRVDAATASPCSAATHCSRALLFCRGSKAFGWKRVSSF